MPTPTGRNRLMELLMSGTQSAMRGDEPEQTGYLLPLARYKGGGVTPAVPGAVSDIVAAMEGGMSANPSDFNSPSPEVREDFDRNALIDALVVGGTATTGGLAVPKPANSVGIFGGRLAKTANQSTLSAAENMASKGVSREQIWNDTGWFQGVDGKWRFEIDDSGATAKSGRSIGFGGAFNHPELQKAYPKTFTRYKIKDDYVDPATNPQGVEGRGDGTYMPMTGFINARGATPSEARSIALHETQHRIQSAEDFAPGATFAKPGYQNDLDYWMARDELERQARGALDEKTIEGLALERIYNRSAGETEARAVQARRDLTPKQRKARPPWLDYDVPESQQIVKSK